MNTERLARKLPELQLGVSALILLGALISLNISADARNMAEAYANSGQVELFQKYNNNANADLNTGLILLACSALMGMGAMGSAMHRSQEDMNRYLSINRQSSSRVR
jgi:mannitol-specific phosphotransferase system IIBC component